MTREDCALQISASVIKMNRKYVEMINLQDKVAAGEVVEGNDLSDILSELNQYMREVQMYQKILGYDVGIPFENDANFENFSIRGGRLEGNLSQVYTMVHPWFEDYIDQKDLSEDAFYKFYIASFINELTEYQYYRKLEEKEAAATEQKEITRKPGFFRWFAGGFKEKKREAA